MKFNLKNRPKEPANMEWWFEEFEKELRGHYLNKYGTTARHLIKEILGE